METAQTEPPTGTPPGFPPLSRLTRSTDDKVVSGLCGGLGRHFAIDPIVFRIAFVVLSLAGGSGLVLYLVLWAVIPDDQGGVIGGRAGEMTAFKWIGADRTRKLVAAVVAGGGLLILLDRITDGTDGDVVLGMVLVGLGLAFFWSRRNAERIPPPDGGSGSWGTTPAAATGAPADPFPSPASTSAAERPAGPVVEVDPANPVDGIDSLAPPTPPARSEPSDPPQSSVTSTAPMPLWPPVPVSAPGGHPSVTISNRPARLPKPPKPRSVLVACTLSVLAIQAGVLVLAGASLVTGLALSVLVVGLALVVGTWMGRARWLIPLGLLLSMALGSAVLLDVPIQGGTGNRVHRPATLAELQSPYRIGAGELIVDLRSLDLAGTTTEVEASAGMGHLVVVVPVGAEIEFRGLVNAGTLRLFDREWGGTSVKRDVVVPGGEGGGKLVLDVQVGVGELEVRRAEA